MTGDEAAAMAPVPRRKARRRVVAVVILAAVAVLVLGLTLMMTTRPQGLPAVSTQAPTPTPTGMSASPTTSASSYASPQASAPGAGPEEVPSPTSAPSETSESSPPAADALPASLLGQDLTAIPRAGPVMALTFDAGADSAALNSILSTLSRENVKATFFLTGSWAAAHPAGVAQIVAAGHRLGNHSMTHPSFTQLPDQAIAEEIVRSEQAVMAAGGDPRPLFRFPFGDRDARTIAVVNSLGYVAVRWSVDTLGWKGTSGGLSRESVTQRVLDGLRPEAIILMHIGSNPDDGTTLDADALPAIINGTRAAGYGLVTLDQLLVG
ncbi:polysaccharide deacetylase family protein [Paenarthrobacter sp. NPDC092416]|uniref:polysaccharide deacetylase family protein n=1 Tax=Paenarthrobacter sp. NPDC092416 TaxID=3364386 RepID=UPI00382BA402